MTGHEIEKADTKVDTHLVPSPPKRRKRRGLGLLSVREELGSMPELLLAQDLENAVRAHPAMRARPAGVGLARL